MLTVCKSKGSDLSQEVLIFSLYDSANDDGYFSVVVPVDTMSDYFYVILEKNLPSP